MTEPNIVYIGDEVLCDEWGTGKEGPYHVACGEGVPDDGSLTTFENGWEPMSCYTTPDGRPVDGFGGAKIELSSPGVYINSIFIDCVDNYAEALYCACKLYGEWVREHILADLKRRGLL